MRDWHYVRGDKNVYGSRGVVCSKPNTGVEVDSRWQENAPLLAESGRLLMALENLMGLLAQESAPEIEWQECEADARKAIESARSGGV
ncbi:hypothetical protein SLPG_00006 [Salicola phage CGphi29]|uniref:hypothetical protein n=1 Tax=Salicola phage CGphi29 TaxID=754067 RepID=UPI0002C04C6C|nr:hypothetical protein SLPG_00006 [Salicola phage CGphi29]AGH31800.1 hypothetical protein SLPG_00006 [Salicola phage CGphi29]